MFGLILSSGDLATSDSQRVPVWKTGSGLETGEGIATVYWGD